MRCPEGCLHECLCTCISVFPFSDNFPACFPFGPRCVASLLSAKPFAQKPSWQRQCDTVVTGRRHKAIIGHTVGKTQYKDIQIINIIICFTEVSLSLLFSCFLGLEMFEACCMVKYPLRFSGFLEYFPAIFYVDLFLVKYFVGDENTSNLEA